MRIAVTGAGGFLGRHVLNELSNHPALKVTAVLRRSHGPALPSAIHHVSMDVLQATPDAYALLGEPDTLLHLAWGGLPNYGSLHHVEQELPGQFRFLKQLVEAGLPSLLCVGTCFEYGLRSGELDENLAPDPQNAYALAKDTLRRQLVLLRATRHFGFTWARLFYMYGEGQSANSLYSQLLQSLDRGDREFRMSKGEQLRDYLPVTEVARILVQLAVHHADCGIVNVCSGQPVSVRALVEGWLRDRNRNIELVLGHYPYSAFEPMAFWGSRAKLGGLLGPVQPAGVR